MVAQQHRGTASDCEHDGGGFDSHLDKLISFPRSGTKIDGGVEFRPSASLSLQN